MAALLHPFVDTRPPAFAPTMTEDAPRLAMHPLQSLLRECLAEAGHDLIRDFVDGLDAAVQALLAESRHAAETRAVLELGQALSINRPALMRGFVNALKGRFEPLQNKSPKGIFDLERLCLLPSEEMEENIALTHLAQLAEQRAGESGRQLQARLQWAARDLSLPALASALSPDALPACFAAALRQAGLGTTDRVLAYRLVESHALKSWPTLVQLALHALDRQGLRHTRTLAATAAEEAPPPVSAATLQTLREARGSLVSGADGTLAQALLRALEPPFEGHTAALITALSAHWLDGLLAEPELPPAFAPDLESLRLAVIKAALCDVSFLSQERHPVRMAVDALAQKAAFIGLQGYSLAEVRSELKDTAAHINIHGHFALDALAMLPPLDAGLAQQFRQQMLCEQETRREALLARVRALAAREVDARTLDVSLPSAARAALARGFLPLLSTLLLRHGAASPRTRLARQLLERFVDSFALCSAASERRAVLATLGETLRETGLPDLHVSGVIAGLEQAYAELEEEAQTSLPHADSRGGMDEILAGIAALPALEPFHGEPLPKPVPVQSLGASDTGLYTLTPISASNDLTMLSMDADPLDVLLKAGQWFRVRDYKHGDDRWLSLSSLHIGQDRVGFSGFDGVTVLGMRAGQFVQDLISGLAEPLNPDSSVQQALQRLRAQPGLARRFSSFS